MAGSYELYAEVLRRTIVKVAGEIGWELEPSRAQFLPDSVARWLPFREANAAMDRLGKRYEIGIVSNIDDKLLGVSRRHLRTELDLVVTAQQVRSYKPDPAHFKECARRIGGKKGWVHIGCGYDDRRRAAAEDERARDLGQPPRREARGAQEADREVKNLPRRGEEARRRRLTRPSRPRPPQPRSRRRGDGRASARALRGRAPARPTPTAASRARRGAAQPDRHRRAQVRDDQPPPLPQPPPRGRDVTTQGAQLLRRRAQLAARARAGTRATSTATAAVRGETSPHYTNLPRFDGCRRADARAARPEARVVYMVRDPIDRMLSHYLHNVGGGYESRPLEDGARRPGLRLRGPQPLRHAAASRTWRRSSASGC